MIVFKIDITIKHFDIVKLLYVKYWIYIRALRDTNCYTQQPLNIYLVTINNNFKFLTCPIPFHFLRNQHGIRNDQNYMS